MPKTVKASPKTNNNKRSGFWIGGKSENQMKIKTYINIYIKIIKIFFPSFPTFLDWILMWLFLLIKITNRTDKLIVLMSAFAATQYMVQWIKGIEGR